MSQNLIRRFLGGRRGRRRTDYTTVDYPPLPPVTDRAMLNLRASNGGLLTTDETGRIWADVEKKMAGKNEYFYFNKSPSRGSFYLRDMSDRYLSSASIGTRVGVFMSDLPDDEWKVTIDPTRRWYSFRNIRSNRFLGVTADGSLDCMAESIGPDQLFSLPLLLVT